MDALEALRELSQITAAQWGLVTTAQAGRRGVSRLYLSRLADAGYLERLAMGSIGPQASRLIASKRSRPP